METKDVYRPDIATCPAGSTLREVAERMEEGDSGIVALVDDERLVGVISERDFVRALAREPDPAEASVADYATTEVVTAAPDEELPVVARRMIDRGVRRLPVIDTNGDLLGLVSMRDVFAVETLMP